MNDEACANTIELQSIVFIWSNAMFRTYRHTAVPFRSKLEPDLQLWPYIEQILYLPWFYASVIRTQGDAISREMLLISDVETWERLEIALGSSGRLTEVLLVSPGPMNGQDRWLMEPLLRIDYVARSRLRGSHYSYAVANGRNYTNDCDPGLGAEHPTTSRLVFSSPR